MVHYVANLNLPGPGEAVLSDERLRARLALLCKFQPHAYNVVQVVTQMAKQHQRIQTLSVLPVHYWWNQLSAVRERLGLSDSNPYLLDHMLSFVYCHVCEKVYSLVRNPHLVYKQGYQYGLRDACLDYETDVLYCSNRTRRGHGGACGEKPLKFVSLLGQVIRFNHQTILMCPQSGCGMPMVYDPAYSLFNDRGVACVDCTVRLRTQRYTERWANLLEEHTSKELYEVSYLIQEGDERECDLCTTPMATPAQMYWYPCNVIVCRKHPNATFKRAIERYAIDHEKAQLEFTRMGVIRFLEEAEIEKEEADRSQTHRRAIVDNTGPTMKKTAVFRHRH